MYATEIRPILRSLRQLVAHRILPHVLPLLRIAFAIVQAMVKPATLERPNIRMRLGKLIFPERHPLLDGELQITRRSEQMHVIRHEQIIAHQPGRGIVFPDFVKHALNGCLCQPTLAFLGADSEKNPIRSAKGKVNAFRRRATPRPAKGNVRHGGVCSAGDTWTEVFFVPRSTRVTGRWGRAAARPYPTLVGRCCRAAPIKSFGPGHRRFAMNTIDSNRRSTRVNPRSDIMRHFETATCGRKIFRPALDARDGKMSTRGSATLPHVGRAALPRRRRRVQKDWLETVRLLLREGFDGVSVTADCQCRGSPPPASRSAGWFTSVACARAGSPRRRECPFPRNGGNPKSPRPCICRFGKR